MCLLPTLTAAPARAAVIGLFLLFQNVVLAGGQEIAQLRTRLRFPAPLSDVGFLTHVTSLAVAPDGDIYVAQPRIGTVRIFDSLGVFLKDLGGRGNGPGEFQSPAWVEFIGDTLFVIDPGANRISSFGVARELIHDYPIPNVPTGGGFRAARALRVVPDQRLVMVPPVNALEINSPIYDRLPVMVVGFDGRGRRTLVTVAAKGSRGAPLALRTPGSVRLVTNAPIARILLEKQIWRMAPDGTGIVLVDRKVATSSEPASFSVRSIGVDGDTAFVRHFAYRPRALSADVANALVDELARVYPTFDARTMVRDAITLGGPMPRFFPPVHDLVVGSDGTIWIGREGTPVERTWTALSGDGRFMFETTIAQGLRVVAGDSLGVWVVGYYPETEEPYIERLETAIGSDGGS